MSDGVRIYPVSDVPSLRLYPRCGDEVCTVSDLQSESKVSQSLNYVFPTQDNLRRLRRCWRLWTGTGMVWSATQSSAVWWAPTRFFYKIQLSKLLFWFNCLMPWQSNKGCIYFKIVFVSDRILDPISCRAFVRKCSLINGKLHTYTVIWPRLSKAPECHIMCLDMIKDLCSFEILPICTRPKARKISSQTMSKHEFCLRP